MGTTFSGWCSTAPYATLEDQLNPATRPERTTTIQDEEREINMTRRYTKCPIDFQEFAGSSLYLIVVSLSDKLYKFPENHIAAIGLRFRQILHPLLTSPSRDPNPISVLSFQSDQLFVVVSDESPLPAIRTACLIRETVLFYNQSLDGNDKKYEIPLDKIRVLKGNYIVYDTHTERLFGDFVRRATSFGDSITELEPADIVVSFYVKIGLEKLSDSFGDVTFAEFELFPDDDDEKVVEENKTVSTSNASTSDVSYLYKLQGDLRAFLKSQNESWPPQIVSLTDEAYSDDKRAIRIVSQCNSRRDISAEIFQYFCSTFICVFFRLSIERIERHEGVTSKADYELFHSIVGAGLYDIYTHHHVAFEFDLTGILFREQDADKALECTVAIRDYIKKVSSEHFLLQHLSINMSAIGVHIGEVLIVPQTNIVFGTPIYITKYLVDQVATANKLVLTQGFKDLSHLKHLSLPPDEKHVGGKWINVYQV